MAYGELKKKTQEAAGTDYSLNCSAHGCPMKWSVEPGRLCSYHAWEDSKKWPSITENLRQHGAWELYRKREVDYKSYPGHPKAWAMRMKDRHEAGEKLSRFQIECYQVALKIGTVVQTD